MTPRYYHSPPKPVSTRVRCPVCREAVYSLAGIHPQCAVRQADPPRPKTRPTAAHGPDTPTPVVPDHPGSDLVAEPPAAELAHV